MAARVTNTYRLEKDVEHEMERILGFRGRNDKMMRYNGVFGPQIRPLYNGAPAFFTQTGYFLERPERHCTRLARIWESSRIADSDGNTLVHHTCWESFNPRVSRDPNLKTMLRRDQGYHYRKRLFSVYDATYILTELLGDPHILFLCVDHIEFDERHVTESLKQYMRSRSFVIPSATKRLKYK